MARVVLDLPDKFVFETELTIRVGDLNSVAHVGNDNMLTLLQEARNRFYRSMGFESEAELEASIGQVIADVIVVYQSEAFYADILKIQMAVADVSKYGFDLFYKVTNKTTGQAVSKAKTGIVCFDYQKRKISPIPANLLRKIEAL